MKDYETNKSKLDKNCKRIVSNEAASEYLRSLIHKCEQTRNQLSFTLHNLSESRGEITSYKVSISLTKSMNPSIKVNGNACSRANLMAVLIGGWIEDK
ncbi:hypothetical protein DZF79_02800 [Vibrio parahaemolyticus]|nr:hypothetical protein [Vibrio parahaemolyticus]